MEIHPCGSCLDSMRLGAMLLKSLRGRRELFLTYFPAWAEQPFIIIVDEKSLFWAGHIMEFQGHFYTLLHPGVGGGELVV